MGGGPRERVSLMRGWWGSLWWFGWFCLVVGGLCADDPPATTVHLLRRVTVSGNSLFKEEFARAVEPLENRPYEPEKLRAVLDAMMTRYHNAGYRFAKVTDVVPRLLDDGFYVGVTVSEGRIAEIRVVGLTKTREEVLLQQLLFRVGMLYREEDALESERILRTRPYLGDAHIEATADPTTNLVRVVVYAEDLWSFVPRVRLTESEHGSLKELFEGHIGFLATATDSNVFGSGQTWRVTYRRDVVESPENGRVKTGRSRIGIGMFEPNLFRSRWQFGADYQQLSRTDRESWELRLVHPFYSLQTTWGVDLRAFETALLDDVRYEGRLIRQWERHITGQYASATRAFGLPHHQRRLSLWLLHQDTSYTLRYSAVPLVKGTTLWASVREEERFAFSPASRPFESEYLAGVDLSFQSVHYVEETNLNRLGRTEDVALGPVATFSLGAGSRHVGNARDEIRPAVLVALARRNAPRTRFFDANLSATMNYRFAGDAVPRTGVENAVVRGQARLFLRRGNRQSLVARLEATTSHRTTDAFSLLLDDRNGLRGYPRYAFDGAHRVVGNVEGRHLFWARPSLWAQGVLFFDAGVIWRNQLRGDAVKRSVGAGIRLAFLRFSESPIVRFDAAYPLDRKPREWMWSIGTGQYF